MDARTGHAQGAVISPLLSNIYLNPMDHLQLRQSAEQLDPVQRCYRILSEALKRYLKGRQLDPPLRLAPA